MVENLPTQLLTIVKEDLTINNPDYEKKLRMGFYIGKTPKKLTLYITKDNDIIVPYGYKDTLLNLIKDLDYKIITEHKNRPVSIEYIGNIKLYDYQENALQTILRHNNGILVSPCGSGKTMIALHIIEKLKCKTLWITHTLDLLNQSYNVCKTLYKNKLGKISEGKINIQDITFATVQTLVNVDLLKIKDEFELIIVDEVHKATGSPNKVMMFYKTITNLNARYKFGLTATLFGGKNSINYTPIYLIGNELHRINEEDISRINATHEIYKLYTEKSDMYLKFDKTLDYMKLVDYLVYNQQRNIEIYNNLKTFKNDYNIILTTRNDHLDLLGDLLTLNGIEFLLLTGKEKKKQRKYVLSEFKKGTYHYLLSNYQLAKEGLDLPIANVLHLVFPIKDKISLIQSKGRVERTFKGKTYAKVIDYVDVNIGYLINMYKKRKGVLK